MSKGSKPFPLKNILFKSTTASPATLLRTNFPRKNQTRSLEKSFATFLIPHSFSALPQLIQFPIFDLQVP
jgi:hypothetical protein